jgi:putative spermidine/putrescine transport system ATP-binding protein
MDEPLGALDKKLREALQLEILRIGRQIEATIVYVTHDQEEALVMSDRIAVFDRGRIDQIGSGEDLYDRPVSLFVADFIGESNILRGRYESDGDRGGTLVREPWHWLVSSAAADRVALASGTDGALVVRPERMRLVAPDSEPGTGWNAIEASVAEVLYLGSTRKFELSLPDGGSAVVRQQLGGQETETAWRSGDRVRLAWRVDDGVLVADGPGPSALGVARPPRS